jgi:septal ring factor EnvC (AmiA/AmiB activator)
MNEPIEELSLCETTCKQVEVPTEDEVEVLNAMRALKERVRSVKGRIAELSNPRDAAESEERSRLEKEMATLKTEWDKLDEQRTEAARVRMVLLGHEEP